MKSRSLIAVVLVASACLGGCVKCPETHVSLERVLADFNHNAADVPRLWTRAKIALKITDEKGKVWNWGSTSPLAGPNGLLLLAKTDDPLAQKDFVLIGRETLIVGDLFRLGTSAAEGVYYLWVRPGDDGRAWWGRQEFAGAPQLEDHLPLDPTQLLSVLSVCELPQDLSRLPAMVMRMSCDPPAYVLTYIDRQPVTGKIIAKREIYYSWSDDGPRRPFLVKLYNGDGDLTMEAKLSNYRTIESDQASDTPPVMPTDIKIDWPRKASRIHIVLSEMTTEDKWDAEACRFREIDSEQLQSGIPLKNVVQIDRDLE